MPDGYPNCVPPRVAPQQSLIGAMPRPDGSRPCVNHPHRFVTTRCERCRTPFCGDCLRSPQSLIDGLDEAAPPDRDMPEGQSNSVSLSGGVRPETADTRAVDTQLGSKCERCADQLRQLELATIWRRRPWWIRLRPTREELRSYAVVAGILTVIATPVVLLVREMAETQLAPEEFARIAIALRGGFAGPDGTNYLNTVFGGAYIRGSVASATGHQPSRLIDTWATVRVPGWRSADGTLPVSLDFALPNDLTVNRVILRPHPGEPTSTWVRDFRVEVSTSGAEGPYTLLVAGELDHAMITSVRPSEVIGRASEAQLAEDRLNVPVFDVPETVARWVRLRIVSNGGSDAYTSLAEFELLYASRLNVPATTSATGGVNVTGSRRPPS